MVMEEAAFIEPIYFYKVCVPLIGVNNTAILAISTPGEGSSNYYNHLLNITNEDGTPMFNTLEIGLACKACQIEGIPDRCYHKRVRLPPWKSGVRQRKQRRILENAGPEIVAQEVMGVAFSGATHPFRSVLLTRWAQDDHCVSWLQETAPPAVVFMAIDPAGGGSLSDFAVCTTVYWKRAFTVSG